MLSHFELLSLINSCLVGYQYIVRLSCTMVENVVSPLMPNVYQMQILLRNGRALVWYNIE